MKHRRSEPQVIAKALAAPTQNASLWFAAATMITLYVMMVL